MKFYIDIGHGEITSSGKPDPGAVSGSFIEHEMNKITGNALAERLKLYGHTVKVEEGNLTIDVSAKAANSWGADLLISCHYNAGGGDRGEVIYSWENNALKLANACAEGMKKAGQTTVKVYKSKSNSAGTAEYFGILRNSKMPAVIIEPAFIDNLTDRQLVNTVEKQKYMGVCIADALVTVYGGALKEEEEGLTEIKVKVNDKEISDGYLINNTSYVPIRAVAEALGYNVGWDQNTKTVLITK